MARVNVMKKIDAKKNSTFESSMRQRLFSPPAIREKKDIILNCHDFSTLKIKNRAPPVY